MKNITTTVILFSKACRVYILCIVPSFYFYIEH